MKKVLVAEDEESIREFIVINLTAAVILWNRRRTAPWRWKSLQRMKAALM